MSRKETQLKGARRCARVRDTDWLGWNTALNVVSVVPQLLFLSSIVLPELLLTSFASQGATTTCRTGPSCPHPIAPSPAQATPLSLAVQEIGWSYTPTQRVRLQAPLHALPGGNALVGVTVFWTRFPSPTLVGRKRGCIPSVLIRWKILHSIRLFL